MIEDGIKHCLHQAFLDLGYQLESFEEGGFDYEEFKKVVLDIEGELPKTLRSWAS
jgi:hypothetical protein